MPVTKFMKINKLQRKRKNIYSRSLHQHIVSKFLDTYPPPTPPPPKKKIQFLLIFCIPTATGVKFPFFTTLFCSMPLKIHTLVPFSSKAVPFIRPNSRCSEIIMSPLRMKGDIVLI